MRRPCHARTAGCGNYLLEGAPPACWSRIVIVGGEALQCNQQADDLLFSHLAGTADAVTRQAWQLAQRRELLRRAPQLREHIEIQHLQQRRTDQVGAAAQDPRCLRPADRLAAAERDEVGTLFEKAAQIVGRRQLCGGIDQQRNAVLTRHSGNLRQRRQRLRVRKIVDRGGVRRDRRGDLPGRGVTHARAAVAVGNAHLDDASAGDQQRAIVHVALAAHDDELVAAVGNVRQAVHPCRIEPGQAGGGAQQHAGGGAGRDDAGLRAGMRAMTRQAPACNATMSTHSAEAACMAAATSGCMRPPDKRVTVPQALMTVERRSAA